MGCKSISAWLIPSWRQVILIEKGDGREYRRFRREWVPEGASLVLQETLNDSIVCSTTSLMPMPQKCVLLRFLPNETINPFATYGVAFPN